MSTKTKTDGKKKTLSTENCTMVATVCMLFTAMSTGLAVFIASGALAGVDEAFVHALWGVAIALASLCLLAAVGGVAIFVMRTHRREETQRRRNVSGHAKAA